MQRFRVIVGLVILLGGGSWLRGMDAEVERALPPGTTVLIEANRPGRVLENRLGQDLWGIIRESAGAKQALSSPQYHGLGIAARFVETSLGVDWQTAFARLTAGGVVLAIENAAPDVPPEVTAFITSDDERLLARFVEAVHAELRKRTAPGKNEGGAAEGGEKPPMIVTRDYRGVTCYSVGNGHYAITGKRLVAANRQALLERALDRLADPAPPNLLKVPQSLRLTDASGNEPLAQVTLKGDLLRQKPETVEALKLPSNNPIPVVLVGGYLDLLARVDWVTAGLFLDDAGAELRVRLPVGSEGTFAGLRGYFAADDSAAAPLLNPARTLFSASWYRNYAQLWNQRAELFNPTLVQQAEEANANQRKRPSGLGFGDLAQFLGPHLRVVAARQQEVVYKLPLEERLPAAAFVIDLADEQGFRERVLGPADALLPVAIAGKGGEVKPAEYNGAKISTVRFLEKDAKTLTPEQLGRYQFNPAWSVTRGHLIIGSTAEIVRDLIDELDRQKTAALSGPTAPVRVTDEQRLSLAEVSDLLKAFAPRLVRSAVLSRGLSVEEAEKELAIGDRVLRRLGQLSTRYSLGNRQFEMSLRVGTGGNEARAEVRPAGDRNSRPLSVSP